MESRPTILVVQPTPDDCRLYAAYLETNGFLPLVATDTADALVSASNADVMVTGLRVPGPFDGLELIRRVRHLSETMSKPIIVLTACACKADYQHAVAAGCDVFLTKPCLPEVLASEIRHLRPSTSNTAAARTALKSDRRRFSDRRRNDDAARRVSELFCEQGVYGRDGGHRDRGVITRTTQSILTRLRERISRNGWNEPRARPG